LPNACGAGGTLAPARNIHDYGGAHVCCNPGVYGSTRLGMPYVSYPLSLVSEVGDEAQEMRYDGVGLGACCCGCAREVWCLRRRAGEEDVNPCGGNSV